MLKNELVFFLLGVILLITWTVYGAEQELVKELTTDSFEKFVKENAVLVEFYAPWCGHCKKLQPEYDKAALILKEKNSPVWLAKVDCTAESDLASLHSIRGYPTLKFFKKGDVVDYTGPRSAEGIVQWIDELIADAVTEIKDADAKIETNKLKSVFVGTFNSKQSDGYQIFVKAADASRSSGIFFVIYQSDKAEQIVVKKEEEDEIKYDGKMEVEALKKWFMDQAFPLLGPINGDNFNNYAKRGIHLVWFCGDANHYEEYKSTVRDCAKEYAGKYSFVFLNIEPHIDHAKDILGVATFPAMVYQAKSARYMLPEAETNLKDSQKLIQFIKDVEDNKIKKHLKSEEIPDKNDKPVKIVVAKSFEEIVFQDDKDVLLEVYAPWCGHCKQLEPIYVELAEKLKEFEDKIVIAKMDGTLNDSPVEGFTWEAFPTIFYIKAGKKTPILYSKSNRSLNDLMVFINENATQKLEKAADKSEEL